MTEYRDGPFGFEDSHKQTGRKVVVGTRFDVRNSVFSDNVRRYHHINFVTKSHWRRWALADVGRKEIYANSQTTATQFSPSRRAQH